MRIKEVLIVLAMFVASLTYGQIKIGDNPQNINASSVLELESTSRAFVITRVNSTQMNAITPLEGAMVYNTDSQCIHYYDGTQWLNLCDALTNISLIDNGDGTYTFSDANNVETDINTLNESLTINNGDLILTETGGNEVRVALDSLNTQTFTTNPVINAFSTMVITEDASGTNFNFEVGIIDGENIQDGSIRQVDLAGASVGSVQLRDNSVRAIAIATDAVTSLKILNGTILPEDIASGGNNQVLVTGAGGTVAWVDRSTFSAISDQVTITGVGTSADPFKVENLSIVTSKLGNNAVTSSKILDETILSEDIFDGTIIEADLADNAVTTGKILNSTILAEDIANDAVTTTKILDANVTNAKLDKANISLSGFAVPTADLSIGNFKLTNVVDPLVAQDAATKNYVDNAITSSNSLTDSNIFVGDVTNTALAVAVSGDATIDNTGSLTIAPDAVTTTKILDANVTNAKLDKANISLSGFAVPTADLSIGNFKLTNVVDPLVAQDAATKNYVDNVITSSNSLTDSNIFVGDVTNTAQAVAISGDATIDNTGSLTIAPDAVTTTKILDANVTNAKLDKANISLSGFAVPTADLSIGNFKLTNVVDPLVAQDAATKNYVDNAITSSNSLTDSNIFVGDVTNTALAVAVSGDATIDNTGSLTIAPDAVTTTKILDANVTNAKLDKANISLSGFAVPTADLSIGNFKLTNVVDPLAAQDAATKNYVDNVITSSNSLTDSNIFVGDVTNTAQAVAISGDATIDNTGSLTIAPDAVTTTKILDANVTNAKLDKANISLSGFAVPTADLSIGNFKLTNVVDPLVAQDAATKNYVDNAITSSNSLTDSNIFVGDVTNTALAVAVSGDATIDNTGSLTIAPDAVTTTKILDANVTNAKLDKANISLSGFAVPTADLSIGNFKLTNVVDPLVAQDAATKNYVDNVITSSNSLTDSNIFVGDVTNTAQAVAISGDATIDNTGSLTIAPDAVTTTKILDANVTNAKLDKANISLSGFAVPTADLSIGNFKLTNVVDPLVAQDAATKNYVDNAITSSYSLTDSNIFVGDVTNTAQAVAVSGDATIDNTGSLTIAPDAVTTTKIANANVSPIKIEPSATNGQVLKTQGGTVTWAEPAVVAMGKVDEFATISQRTNGASATRNSSGNYTVTFTSPRATPDYIIQLTLLNAGPGTTIEVTNQQTSFFEVQISKIDIAVDPNSYTVTVNNNTSTPPDAHSHPATLDGSQLNNTTIISIDASWFFTVTDF